MLWVPELPHSAIRDSSEDATTRRPPQIRAGGSNYLFGSPEYDKALTLATDAATRAIQKQLVIPLIGNLGKPLQNLELGDESRVYLMQEELTAILAELLNNKISELLRLTLGKQQPDSLTELLSVFELTEVKTKVLAFFESFKVGDLFLELFEMERNRKILDKQEFYLYFGDITYDSTRFLYSAQRNGQERPFDTGIRLSGLYQQAGGRIRGAGGQRTA